MATTSSIPMNPLLGIAISEKLSKHNHAIWKAQVLAAVRGARLTGHLTGVTAAPPKEIDGKVDGKDAKVPNPVYHDWYATDQQVLGFLLSSPSREAMIPVAKKETAAAVWEEIEVMFASQTRARAVNTRLALATAQKGNQSVAEYVGKMRSLAEEMAAAGRPLDDEELIEYILTGLDYEFNPVVTSIIGRTEPVTVSEAYSQLLAFETRMELMHGSNSGASSANAANRGGRGVHVVRGRGVMNRGRGGPGAARGRGSGGPGGNNGGNVNTSSSRPGGNRGSGRGKEGRPICQICFKTDHTADRCWYRHDDSYVPDEKHVVAVTNSYNVDPFWYADSGATDHITGELEKLAVRDKFNGTEQIHTASGAGSGHEDHAA